MSMTYSMADAALELVRAKSPYLALLRAVPDRSGGGGQEVAENSYARQSVSFAPPEGGTMRNAGRVEFPVALTDWGNVAAYALYDAESGGTMLWFDVLESAAPVRVGSRFYVDAEGLSCALGASCGAAL